MIHPDIASKSHNYKEMASDTKNVETVNYFCYIQCKHLHCLFVCVCAFKTGLLLCILRIKESYVFGIYFFSL